MRAIFDVGANDGSSGINFAEQNPDVKVFAFEPTPELVVEIREKTANLKNYELIPNAVSQATGSINFNVSGHYDWGTSSLLSFQDTVSETWPGRPDLISTHTIEVECIRLDTFIEQKGIEEIVYFHCDTQGTDLDVLFSMGRHVRKILRGNIEAASSSRVALYDNQHTLTDAAVFLDTNGFRVDSISTHQPQFNEVDIFFSRVDMSISQKILAGLYNRRNAKRFNPALQPKQATVS